MKKHTIAKTILTIALITPALTGCISTDEDPYPNMKIVDGNAVASCKLLGNISATSTTPYGFFSETAHESLIKMAKKEGYKLGASHIVLDAEKNNDDTLSTNGKAYICAP